MSLPKEYTRLEYIQSSGTQYINTKFVPNKNTKVEFKILSFSAQSSANAYPQLFGVQRLANGTDRFGMSADFNVRTGPTNMKPSSAAYDVALEGSLECNKYILEGVEVTASDSFTVPSVPIYLFSINSADTQPNYANLNSTSRFYYFKIYDNGNLVRDFIPAKRNADAAIGLYDLINNAFYTNAGTGTLIAGPVLTLTAPSNFRVVSIENNEITLAWDEVPIADGYYLYKNGVLYADLTSTEFTEIYKPYWSVYYRLVAYNEYEESTPVELQVSATSAPETPTNFRAASTMRTINLSWSDVGSTYVLTRGDKIVYQGSRPLFTDTGLTAGTSYVYTLKAINEIGSSEIQELEVETTEFSLVTDRTQADLEALKNLLSRAQSWTDEERVEFNLARHKGAYNYTDLNRVTEAMDYLNSVFKERGYATNYVQVKAVWDAEDVPTASQMHQYLKNVEALRYVLPQLSTTPQTPESMENLTVSAANNIEIILLAIHDVIIRMMLSWLYSGEVYCGEV